MKITKMERYRRQTERIIMKKNYTSSWNFFPGLRFCHEIEESLKKRLNSLTKLQNNQMKVLLAVRKTASVRSVLALQTSSYGYNDYGRDTLEKVYADTFHTEACLVRPQIACGTHV